MTETTRRIIRLVVLYIVIYIFSVIIASRLDRAGIQVLMLLSPIFIIAFLIQLFLILQKKNRKYS